jgi:transposase
MLGVEVRTVRRWRRRYEAPEAEGLADRRWGRGSARRVPVAQGMQVLGLFQTHDVGFTVKHFHEQRVKRHGLRRSYTGVKQTLQQAGKGKQAKRRGAQRRKRAHKPWVGMRRHQDGSR